MSEEELIETLRAFENKRVEQLKEPAKNVFYAIMKLADERDKYKNIIKEVREYIEEKVGDEIHDMMYIIDVSEVLDILDKESK